MKNYNRLAMLPAYFLAAILCIGLAMWGSRTVTVMNQNSTVSRTRCVVIDAGHGGIDGGAVSCTGVRESQINLEIAIRLQDLMQLLGYRTQMIRTTDVSVYTKGNTIAAQKVSDLKERVRICNETTGAVLVSLHQNTFSDSNCMGPQVFYAATEGSQTLADIIQRSFHNTCACKSRQAKRADAVFLLNNIKCTGVLIECGFLSNPGEESLLRSPAYQKMICGIIAGALSDFFQSDG